MSLKIEIDIEADGYPYVATEKLVDGVLKISIRKKQKPEYAPEETVRREDLEDMVNYLQTFRLYADMKECTLYAAMQKLVKLYPDAITALQALKEMQHKHQILNKVPNIWQVVDYMKKVSYNPETVGECQSQAYQNQPVTIGQHIKAMTENDDAK